jgi:CO dehydrogenase maturation factor
LPVLAIDADINQHLAESFGLAETPPPLGLEINRLKKYLRGSNSLITSNEAMIKTTPPGRGSRLLNLTGSNPIYDYFQQDASGVKLMAIGPFDQNDLGVKCYHSKVGALELILNHLIDGEKEYLVADMTAGADSFASGLFTRFDITFVIVEPTLKSLTVYKQYEHYSRGYGINLKAIGNKIESQDDLDFLKNNLGANLVSTFSKSNFVKSLEKGQFKKLAQLEPENLDVLKTILKMVDTCQKDWPNFYKQMLEFHIKNGESWANAQLGIDAKKQTDPGFSFNF